MLQGLVLRERAASGDSCSAEPIPHSFSLLINHRIDLLASREAWPHVLRKDTLLTRALPQLMAHTIKRSYDH